MKVLFAVSNESTSQAIMKKYRDEYKQIISHKNVYYFNAILKELQRDKSYDRIVIAEDLEQYVNNDYEQMDKFLFDRLDSISDEASNLNGENIPIILICSERRNKSEQLLVKLFGIGVYDALIGNDRSAQEVCKLINRPRSKKEAKTYYKIDADDVSYGKEDENDVSELEIRNILAHYKRIANDEDKYVESFESIAEQYNDTQLKIISKCLPLNVKAVLEEKSSRYQQINSYNNKISDSVRVEKKQENLGTSEILLKNDKTKKMTKPVVIPTTINANNKKKISSKPSTTQILPKEKVDIEEEEKSSKNTQIQEMPIIDEVIQEESVPVIEMLPEVSVEKNEEVQPIKRGRGRPKKNVVEPVSEQPKRKRGRPKKVVELEEIETTEINSLDFEENKTETILPGFEDIEDEVILPGFDEEEQEENEDEVVLPGFEDEEQEEIKGEVVLPGFEEENYEENEDEVVLPGFEEENQEEDDEDDNNEITLIGFNGKENIKENQINPELDMNEILNSNQKLVAFVGTSKNGTSFLINNIAEILSMNGVNTAILDLTRNRNSYYIYTKNNEQLRNQSNYITNNLKSGNANGIIEHQNLTIYTSPIEGDENLEAVEPIIKTLAQNHSVILLDCDFNTPMRYFKYADEIYLVQSMDILTIQPLTVFLRQLLDKGMFEPSKARVVLNKFIRTKEITESRLIGGMSFYNDAGMTVRKELFDRRTIPNIVIPFDLKSYLRYLDGLVITDVSLKGYNKDFIECLKALATMVYPQIGKDKNKNKKTEKYMPPSVKANGNSSFSPRMNNTLNQMRKNY